MSDLLTVRDLSVEFDVSGGVIKAVDGVSFRVPEGRTVALVGESGSGKSVVSQTIMGILPKPARITGGQIVFRDPHDPEREVDIAALDPNGEEMRAIRGGRISIIFQEPMTSLSPLHTIGDQIGEALHLHRDYSRAEGQKLTSEMLRLVSFPDPVGALKTYPFELSGGLRQRAMIAMALVCRPALLIADEPTTALDVTIQAQILDLIGELQRSEGMSVLLITHDLAVVAENTHHVAVMYAGKVVEYAAVEELYERPRHPYTIGLFNSLPDLAGPGERLHTIPGIVPSAFAFPSGCRYRTRCSIASPRCAEAEPSLKASVAGSVHTIACHHVDEAERLR